MKNITDKLTGDLYIYLKLTELFALSNPHCSEQKQSPNLFVKVCTQIKNNEKLPFPENENKI